MNKLTNRLQVWRFYRGRVDQSKIPPDRDLVITGIPRSGTSLVCKLVSQAPNAYCVNEVFYRIENLLENLHRTRTALVAGRPVPNKRAADMRPTSNTVRDHATVGLARAKGPFDANAVVASKVNLPYLNSLPDLLKLGVQILAVVRDPLWTIASWNTEAAQAIPEYRVTDADLAPRWANWQFQAASRVDRQVEIWKQYGALIRRHASTGAIDVLTYERLTSGEPVHLDPVLPGSALVLDTTGLEAMNSRDRYAGVPLERISESLAEHHAHELYDALADLSI